MWLAHLWVKFSSCENADREKRHVGEKCRNDILLFRKPEVQALFLPLTRFYDNIPASWGGMSRGGAVFDIQPHSS
jgi:hypothetical protein